MIAMTTNSSISVKAQWYLVGFSFIRSFWLFG